MNSLYIYKATNSYRILGFTMALTQAARRASRALLAWFVFVLSGAVAATALSAAAADTLYERYQAASQQAYMSAVEKGVGAKPAAGFEQLLATLATDTGSTVVMNAQANLDLIQANLSHGGTQKLVARLLREEAYFLADAIRQKGEQSGDRYLMAKLNYEFAKHHLNRNQWNESRRFLEASQIRNALTKEQQDFANIMHGILLQRRSDHRAAIPYYESVGSESPHYAVAQLNLATVYIRQDWWTDAHTAIKKARAATNDKVLIDRLYTVLGFSQLQKELYRDARGSFRKVRTDSPYSRRALFGLGLAALHQGDHTAALNAFRLLKEQDAYDKSIAESYLMSAMALEKLGQIGAASAAFNEAIAYYEKVSRELEDALKQNATSLSSQTSLDKFVMTAEVPAHVDRTIQHLQQAQTLPADPATNQELAQVLDDYLAVRRNLTKAGLEQSQAMIQHYLNQARFALARLHDTAN